MITCRRLEGCLVLELVRGMVLGVDVFIVLVLMIRGLSDTGVSASSPSPSPSPGPGVSAREKGGMELPRRGVAPAPVSASLSLVCTRMGVLSTTTSPPSTQPGDLGSIKAIVFTGVSQAPDPESEATAMGVRSTPSLADRGS